MLFVRAVCREYPSIMATIVEIEKLALSLPEKNERFWRRILSSRFPAFCSTKMKGLPKRYAEIRTLMKVPIRLFLWRNWMLKSRAGEADTPGGPQTKSLLKSRALWITTRKELRSKLTL